MKKTLLLLTILTTGLLSSCGDSDWKIGGKVFTFENISDNAFVIHGPLEEPNEVNGGFMNNPAVIVGKKGLIVVDPSGTYQTGKKVLAEIEKISTLPVVGVFNTHIHGDHWLGNQAIIEKYPNAKIYAHPKMIERIKNGDGEIWLDIMDRTTKGASKGTKITPPTDITKHLEKITLAGEDFVVHNPTENSHTNTDIAIEHKQSGTVFMGDNAFLQRLGQFDTSSDIHNNIEVLKYVKTLGAKNYVPGHGKTGSYNHTIQPFLDYLEGIKTAAINAYENDLQAHEVKEEVIKKLTSHHNWSGFEEVVGPHLIKMLAEVEERDF